MGRKSKIFMGVVVVLVAIQLIQPKRNDGEALSNNDVSHAVNITPEVQQLLQRACYDCHSNHTNYIWYCSLQPLGFWITHHINEGKEELNFSEFNTYELKRKDHKLKGIAKLVRESAMPISSYLLMHNEARLTPEEREKIAVWAEQARAGLGK